jgi:hypothetical protein
MQVASALSKLSSSNEIAREPAKTRVLGHPTPFGFKEVLRCRFLSTSLVTPQGQP